MNKLYKLSKKTFFWDFCVFLLLLILFFVLFWKLFFKSGYVSVGDNPNLYEKLYLSSWDPSQSNGISREAVVSSYVYPILLARVCAFFGFGLEFSSKISYFLPIVVAMVVFYVVLKRVSRSSFYSFVGLFSFILSVLSIEHMAVFFLVYFLHVSSLVVLTYFIFRRGFDWEKIGYKRILALVFLSFLNLHPFYFIIYNLYLFLYLLFITWKDFKLHNIAKFIFVFISTIIINLFWILPFFMSIFSGGVTPSNLYGVSNFNAVLAGYINHSTVYRVLIGSVYPIKSLWDRLVNNYLIFSYFAIFALTLYFIVYSFSKKNKTASFFSVIFAIFLGLSFWPNNPILGGLWDFLLGNYSFFGFFRSFNRFITVLLPTMLVIIGISYKDFPKKRILNMILFIILTLILFGRRNLMTGDLGGIVPIYNIPKEYSLLNKELKDFEYEEKEIPRIITYPKTDYEAFVWNKNPNYNELPTSGFNFLNYYLDAEILMSKYGNHILISEGFFKNIYDNKYCLETENYLKDLRKIHINYVLLNKDLITLEGDTVSFKNYRSCLENSNFSLLLSNEYFDFFKINYSEDYEKNYKILEVYPFYYKVTFDFKGQENSELVFPQSFNSGWKLYFYDSEDLGFLEKNAIPFYNKEIQVQHFDNEPGNKWLLNKNDFNDDNVTLHLYYYPQIYVVIGSVISLFSIITLVTVGVGLGIKSIKNKNVINIQ